MSSIVANAKRFIQSDFARHGLLVFIASISMNALGYAFHSAISRKIGVEQYGVLSALNAAYMIGSVAAVIVSTIVVKYAAEFRAAKEEAHLAAMVRGLSLYGSIAAAVVIVAGYVSTPAIAAYLKISDQPSVSICIAMIGISSAGQSLRSVFTGIEDFGQYTISAVMESLLKAVFGIGFAYAGYGVVGALTGWAIGSTVTFAYTMSVLLLRYRRVPAQKVFVDMRRLAITMAGVSSATLLLTSISYVDVIVVKHYADPTTAGLYGALSLAGKILLFFVSFVPIVLLPKATRQALDGKSPIGILLMSVAVVLAFSGVGLIFYYAFPVLIITALAGSSFAAGAPYVFPYGIAMVVLAALNVVVVYKIGIHRFDFVIPLALCAAGELVGISIYHSSLTQIIEVLIAGNTVALAASSYGITSPIRPAATSQRQAAA